MEEEEEEKKKKKKSHIIGYKLLCSFKEYIWIFFLCIKFCKHNYFGDENFFFFIRSYDAKK